MKTRAELLNPIDVIIYGERVAWEMFKENKSVPNGREFTIRNRAYRADLSRKS